MNIVDIIIIIFILFGFLIGWKNGFTKQLVTTIGFILAVILAYILKNPVASFFYRVFPFFEFSGYRAFNIILYEFLAFAIVFSVLYLILKILTVSSSIFEKVLNATIILGIPSKILGAVLGVLEYIVVTGIVLFFLCLPVFDLPYVKESKFASTMLTKDSFVSKLCNNSLELYDKIDTLKKDYGRIEDKKVLNEKTVDLLIEYKVVSKDDVNYLIRNNKLKDVKQKD